jgi:4-amino-4-deoxy-L-arabinose transferase-like glycosyltransferase
MILCALLLISALAHGHNMFGYPYYENDEGTYMSQARSLFTTGELAHYTYWYDHAPVGWAFIGLWSNLVAPFTPTPFSLESGRVFMLVIHLLSSALVFGIAKKITKENLPAIIAVCLFSLSPLALTYQRRVLLDNIQSFWTLLALFLILGKERKLIHYVASAVCFITAVLSKETAIFFTPAFLYTIFTGANRSHRVFAVGMWVIICLVVGLTYPLYALLNNEFFPTGHPLGGDYPHVSLLETIQFQMNRPGGWFLDPDSAFMRNFREWALGIGYGSDRVLILGGLACTILLSLLAIVKASLRPVALMTICYWLFFIRGSVVFNFYVIPIIPFLALCIGLCLNLQLSLLKARISKPPLRTVIPLATAVGFFALVAAYYDDDLRQFTNDETTARTKALQWVVANAPRDAFIVMEDYGYVDLHGLFANAHFFWKVDYDPEISEILEGDWCNIDYLVSNRDLVRYAYSYDMNIVIAAYENSAPIIRFPADGGRDFEVRQVDKSQCDMGTEQVLPVTTASVRAY